MRLFRFLPALSLLFGARAFSLESRDPALHPLDARDLIDVCACIKTELVVPNSEGIQTSVGMLDDCLCLSTLSLFLGTNEAVILAVTTAGGSTVSDILKGLIDNAAAKSNCVFPPHSEPNCAENNLCGFECIDGFMPYPLVNPNVCKCLPANVIGGRRSWECIDTVHGPEGCESCDSCVSPLSCSPSAQLRAVSTNAREALVFVGWPVGDESWITATGVEDYITRYKLYEDEDDIGVGSYALEFTNIVMGTYQFQDETGKFYSVDAFEQGDHTLRFNCDSDRPSIVSLKLI